MNPRRVISAPVSAIAAHEGSHAVVASHLGFPIERVTIVPTADTNGAAHFVMPQPVAELGTEVDWLVRQATISAAGRAGEELFGYLTTDLQDSPLSDDASFASLLAPIAVDDDEANALATWVRARAAAIVAKLAPEIATVARALDVKQTLHRDELRRLMPSLADGRMSPIALRSFSIPLAIASSSHK